VHERQHQQQQQQKRQQQQLKPHDGAAARACEVLTAPDICAVHKTLLLTNAYGCSATAVV
jgi:hypothetical protein